jgi:AcrR family transcriptional regulator
MATDADAQDDEPIDAAADDPLREQLLDAAASVFASKGYFGTRLIDIVKAAGLSSGAVYGRFDSKDDLLMEAVLSRVERNAWSRRLGDRTVGEAIVEASRSEGPLDDTEAMRLEAYVAARREPKLAEAIAEGRKRWREAIEPLVQKAIADGTARPDGDLESIVFFIDTMRLGLLVQRAAGVAPPDPEAWMRFMQNQLRSVAEAGTEPDERG